MLIYSSPHSETVTFFPFGKGFPKGEVVPFEEMDKWLAIRKPKATPHGIKVPKKILKEMVKDRKGIMERMVYAKRKLNFENNHIYAKASILCLQAEIALLEHNYYA